tara:strand:+ start:8655 stop:10424 length:1770 start_codon:yes stop_codon:yes gene_type:complete
MKRKGIKGSYQWTEKETVLLSDIQKSAILDLNCLRSPSCFEDFSSFPRVDFTYAKENGVVGHNQELINQLLSFLNSYALNGRQTISKNLWYFFVYQYKKGVGIGSTEGVTNYRSRLRYLVKKGDISRSLARERLMFISAFLMSTGATSKPISIGFSKTYDSDSKGNSPYIEKEFKEIINILYTLYEHSKSLIEEHIDRKLAGIRSFNLNAHPGAVFEYSILHLKDNQKETVDYVATSGLILKQLMASATMIFAYHTWGNTTQIRSLKVSDMDVDNERSSSGYVYKGRGFKFIRLSIGHSDFVSEIAGYKWFKGYVDFRKKLIDFFCEYEEYQQSDYLFFSSTGKGQQALTGLTAISTQSLSATINDVSLMTILHNKYNLPNITIPRIRKTCEQLADHALKDPFAILEKSQHEWDVYQSSYAKSNPLTAKINLSNALNALHKASTDNKVSKESLVEFGIKIVDASEKSVTPLANGFGCNTSLPETKIEQKFLHKQRKKGNDPKVCADFSNCINCEKCTVIEDPSAIYKVLSFKNSLEFSRTLYKGSEKAKARYINIIEAVNLILGSIDTSTVAIAEKRIKTEGYDPVWKR